MLLAMTRNGSIRGGTAPLVKRPHHVCEVPDMTSELHIQKILQFFKSISGEAKDKPRKFPRRANALEPPANKSEPIQI